MSDDADLQARIAALAGKINQHKQQPQPVTPDAQHHQPHYYPSQQTHGRWSPYRATRGGRGGYPQTYQNRTLVLGGANKSAHHSPDAANGSGATRTHEDTQHGSFVSARARGVNQVMSKDTFEREQKQKAEQQQQLRAAKKQKLDQPRTGKPMSGSPHANRELVIDGVRFQVREDGSKLTRIPDAVTADKETPKKAKIADVEFLRTKHGNLAKRIAANDGNRSVARKARPQCEHFAKNGIRCLSFSGTGPDRLRSIQNDSKAAGNCPYGPTCKFSHDPEKVAICKDFLHAGTCPSGADCDLSHELSYHRVPACTHFMRGNCTNGACRYPHVHVSPTAPVCRSFATIGYCAAGNACAKRHVVECPDYANHGRCAKHEKGKCSLPHTVRASTLRKAAARQAKTGSDDESDMSSEEEEDVEMQSTSDEIDSDAEDFTILGVDGTRELADQEDFIAFS